MNSVQCPYKNECSGCDHLDIPYEIQKANKIKNLQSLFHSHDIDEIPEIKFHSAAENQLRSRFDFTLHKGKMGLYEKPNQHQIRQIVDLKTCLQLSPELQDYYTEFRNISIPIQKGSIRLRVGPKDSNGSYNKGCWLDFSNEDIKTLLDEKTTLLKLLKIGSVEIGQKKKNLVLVGEELKLKECDPNIWFETVYQNKNIPLYCWISSFTQPSLLVNKTITQRLSEWKTEIKPKSIFEFGSGIGNLSFPFMDENTPFTAAEMDEKALMGFRKSLAHQTELSDYDFKNIKILQGDYQKLRTDLNLNPFDLVLLNPPRSGIKELAQNIIKDKPKNIIYMSCYPESLILDLKKIKTGTDYKIQKIEIIDQFPQTNHYEVLCYISR